MGADRELWAEGTFAVKSVLEQTRGEVRIGLAPKAAPACLPGDVK